MFTHDLSEKIISELKDIFLDNEFNNKINDETMGKLEDAVIPLEESWANSRYPDWSIEPIWIPSQQYTLDNAIQI
jgi:hypothetical protein